MKENNKPEVIKFPSGFERVVGKKEEAVECCGRRWIAGIDKSDAEYPEGLTDLISYYPIVVKWIEKYYTKLGDTVGVSLPTEIVFREIETGEWKKVKELSERIKTHTGKKVVVFPQGVIALEWIFSEGLLKPGRSTLVIDGGFNTVNLALVDKNGKVTFYKTISNELGIRDLLEKYFRPLLAEKIGGEISANLLKLKRVFLDGFVDMGFERINVKGEKKEALESYMDALFTKIKGELTRKGETFEQFTIVGGLSYYIDEIRTNKEYFLPKEGGEFLTVKGMWKALKRQGGSVAIDFGFGDVKVAAEGLRKIKKDLNWKGLVI